MHPCHYLHRLLFEYKSHNSEQTIWLKHQITDVLHLALSNIHRIKTNTEIQVYLNRGGLQGLA